MNENMKMIHKLPNKYATILVNDMGLSTKIRNRFMNGLEERRLITWMLSAFQTVFLCSPQRILHSSFYFQRINRNTLTLSKFILLLGC